MLRLEVHAPPADDPEGAFITHVYDDVKLLRQDPSFVSEYAFQKYTQPNATISIAGEMLQVSSYWDLPEGTWRARVLLGSIELLNGTCSRDGIEYDDVVNTFIVQVMDDSAKTIKDRLRSVRLTGFSDDSYGLLEYNETVVLARFEYRSNVTTSGKPLSYLKPIRSVRAYTLISVVNAVFNEAGLGDGPSSLYDAVAMVETAGPDRPYVSRVHEHLHIWSLQGFIAPLTDVGLSFNATGYSKASLTLPNWDGLKLVENASKLCGWTLAARYAAFPDPAIQVELLPDTWDETEGLTVIDGEWDTKRFTLRREEAEKKDMAVSLKTMDTLPDIVTWGNGYAWVSADDPQIDQIWTPPLWATRASERWLFDDAGKPVRGDTIEIDFMLSPACTYGDQGYLSRGNQPRPVQGGGTTPVNELIGYPLFTGPGDDACYLGTIVDVPGDDRSLLLWEVLVEPADGQWKYVNPAWAPNVFRNYQLARAKMDVVEGAITENDDTPLDSFMVGRLAEGFEFAGRSWLATRIERATKDGTMKLRGVRPVDEPPVESEYPTAIGAVTGLAGEFVDVENNVSPEKEYVHIWWDWPRGQGARATFFQVQTWTGSGFQDLDVNVFGRHVYVFDWPTRSDTQGTYYTARVRAVMGGSPALYGDWTDIRVYV